MLDPVWGLPVPIKSVMPELEMAMEMLSCRPHSVSWAHNFLSNIPVEEDSPLGIQNMHLKDPLKLETENFV